VLALNTALPPRIYFHILRIQNCSTVPCRAREGEREGEGEKPGKGNYEHQVTRVHDVCCTKECMRATRSIPGFCRDDPALFTSCIQGSGQKARISKAPIDPVLWRKKACVFVGGPCLLECKLNR
jgi:hypothetical protein